MPNAMAMVCMDEAVAWARERITFGQRLIDHQVIRHKFVEMAKRITATQAFIEKTAWQMENESMPITELSMVKLMAAETMEYCAREAVQVFGGSGFMHGN